MIKKHNSQIVRYIFFGVLNTAITFLLYVFLVGLGVQYLVASTICYLVGIVEGFVFNGIFVFNEKLELTGLSKYFLVYLVSYLISIFVLFSLVHYLNLNELISQATVIILITFLNFKLLKWLVFCNV